MKTKILNNLQSYEVVVIHFMDEHKKKIIKSASNKVNFLWIIWGMDYISLIPEMKINLYGKKTKKILNHLYYNSINSHIKQILNRNSLYLKVKTFTKIAQHKFLLNKINYYSTVLPEEANFVKSKLRLKANYIPFNYGLTDSLFKKNFYKLPNNNQNILCGNSGTFTNNHFDVFEILRNLELGNRKLIVPLSYGNIHYINMVNQRGNELFGDNFLPLLEFKAEEEYFKILSSCSVCIMNHFRQQAGGNIVIMMWLGAKIFLSEQNPFYHFFKKRGAFIFSVESDLMNNCQNILTPLVKDLQMANRAIVEKYFGNDAIIKRARACLNVITNKN